MSPDKNDPGGVGNPATNLKENTEAVRHLQAAVRSLETHREYLTASNNEVKADVREMRDRLAKLEIKVDNLPTKEWIGGAVNKAVGFTAAAVAIIAFILHLTGH